MERPALFDSRAPYVLLYIAKAIAMSEALASSMYSMYMYQPSRQSGCVSEDKN
jgi:hypothetical protein